MHTDALVTSVQITVLLLGMMGYIAMATCPSVCQCHQDYYVYCQNADIDDSSLAPIVNEISRDVVLLDLSYNNLEILPANAFVRLSGLKILNLQSNRIHAVSGAAFGGLIHLVSLKLNNNSLHGISQEQWNGLRSLESLHLSSNYIDIIAHKTFFYLANLTNLYLDENHIGVIENDTFLGLRFLKLLDVSKNVIHRIENNSFADLRQLKRLQLSFNELTRLDDGVFHGLVKLNYFHLDYNRLVDISHISWSDLQERLRTLTLSHNHLTTLPHNLFYGFRNLKKVRLGHNRISVFPGSALNGQFLEELSLLANEMTHVNRDMFSKVKRIVKLDLSANKIRTMDTGSFDSFKDSVYVLNMDDNSLETLHPGMFRGMTVLKILRLANNSIRTIDKGSLSDLTQLEELSLSHNKLTDFNAAMLSIVLPNRLYLNCNPLKNFIGFTFSPSQNPIRVFMNVTVMSVDSDHAVVQWPYKHGTQVYWTLSVTCLKGDACDSTHRKDEYLPPYKGDCLITKLAPLSEYYVCVRPVFVEDVSRLVSLEQCIHVYTARSRKNSSISVSPTGRPASGVQQSLVSSLIVLFIILHTLSAI